MADATPKRFRIQKGDLPLNVDNVELHRAFETDKSGLTSIHVWITADVTPPDDRFQSITADIAFVLSHGDDELGVCTSRAVTFETQEPATIRADDELRIDLNADVTGITVQMDVIRIIHTKAEQTLDPA